MKDYLVVIEMSLSLLNCRYAKLQPCCPNWSGIMKIVAVVCKKPSWIQVASLMITVLLTFLII